MRPRILLINPWVHDFAAYNLWARPLGLLTVSEFLSAFDADLRLIDCMDCSRSGRYGTGKYRSEIIAKPRLLSAVPRRYKRYGIGLEDFRSRLHAAAPFDVVLITSIMAYWYPGVQQTIACVRDAAGDVPIVLGGIYPALYPVHASEHSGADIVFRGRADDTLPSVLAQAGISLERVRPPVPAWQSGFYPHHAFAPLLTSRGCPYQCSYCASPILSPSYERRPVSSIMNELAAWHAAGVRDFAFYDDALLYQADRHIKPLLRQIAHDRLSVRLHAPNGLHARFMDQELAGLMKHAGFETVRLSLETIDPSRQTGTGGKVATRDFEEAVRLLRRNGFGKEQIGVYLLYGLPGQALEEAEAGVDFLMNLGVRIMLAEFSPIPGTGSWSELVASGLIADGMDPLMTNNTVFSLLCSGYDPDQVSSLKIRVKEYNSLP